LKVNTNSKGITFFSWTHLDNVSVLNDNDDVDDEIMGRKREKSDGRSGTVEMISCKIAVAYLPLICRAN